jgi:diguanylate cyclase (GGDEF)-like protein
MRGIGSPARTMAINGAMLYGAGAALVALFLLAPHSPATNTFAVVLAGMVATAVTGLLVIGRDWLPAWPFPTLTAAGTALITVLVVCDGSRPSAFMLLYVWAAVYSFYFYRLPIALIEAAWIAVAAALGQALTSGGGFPLFRWMMITATSVMAGLAVRQLVVQIQTLADRDALTGVFSRRRYHEEVEREISRARRSGRSLCLMLLDLDNFKRMNDDRGHVQGDRHLHDTAQAWLAALRAADILARYGGEEFVVILPETALTSARDTADRLRAAVPGDQTASAGVAEWDGSESAIQLLARADIALYEAKAAGRNATMVSTPTLKVAPAG